MTPLHHPQNEFRRELETNNDVPITHTRTGSCPGKLIYFHDNPVQVTGAGSGRGRGTAQVEVAAAGWPEPPSPNSTVPPPPYRGRATHTLYGSRGGTDVSVILKETFDLRKRQREIKVGQRDRGMGRLESQHYMVPPFGTETSQQTRAEAPTSTPASFLLRSTTSSSASWGPPKMRLSKALPENWTQRLKLGGAYKIK